ncbi:hypothetical protein E2C01_040680 [Portunus trituberculatus]|uniref:Secreted protein n=1 Tax=Portunus trituberculatus TaxID=210409 RepID=A0A5B7FPV6_PORTR|nr:hypothetical protein [Portunus trituberculatus]
MRHGTEGINLTATLFLLLYLNFHPRLTSHAAASATPHRFPPVVESKSSLMPCSALPSSPLLQTIQEYYIVKANTAATHGRGGIRREVI